MDIDSGNPATVVGTKNVENHDIEKAESIENTPVVVGKLEDESAEPGLPFSKARLIGLVLCLSLSAFLNVCAKLVPFNIMTC
jgi:hypothetical protein